jgi:hypothetical protein
MASFGSRADFDGVLLARGSEGLSEEDEAEGALLS